MQDHEKFGHQVSTKEVCQPCIIAGGRRRTIERVIPEDLKPLEVIDIDLLGPLTDQHGNSKVRTTNRI